MRAVPGAQGAQTPAVLDCPGRQGQLVAALHTWTALKLVKAVGITGQFQTWRKRKERKMHAEVKREVGWEGGGALVDRHHRALWGQLARTSFCQGALSPRQLPTL